MQSRRDTFRCVHCKFDVPLLAMGTVHRNHCPLCLWSKHVDDAVGDRRSICGGAMRPLGLTLKSDDAELMLIHQCLSCGKISKNRIAGDDNSVAIESVFEEGLKLPEQARQLIARSGIALCEDIAVVKKGLYGRS